MLDITSNKDAGRIYFLLNPFGHRGFVPEALLLIFPFVHVIVTIFFGGMVDSAGLLIVKVASSTFVLLRISRLTLQGIFKV